MFKRKPISFNLDCPHQKALYEWCTNESVNFSGFVKTVLFLHMQSQNSNYVMTKQQPFIAEDASVDNDLNLVTYLL